MYIRSKFLLVLAFATLVWLIFTAGARADCSGFDPASDSARITFEDRRGLWFSSAFARCILQDVELLEVGRAQIKLLDESLTLAEAELALTTEALDLSKARSKELSLQLQAATKEAAEKDGPFDSPYLWFTVGLVIGGGLITAVAFQI